MNALLVCIAVGALALLKLQTGDWLWVYPGDGRVLSALALAVLYALFCTVLRRNKQRNTVAATASHALSAELRPGTASLLVTFASQTGFAEQLALQTAGALHSAGVPATIAPLSGVGTAQLTTARRALFVVSTTGEGDAPDSAAAFTDLMNGNATLHELRYGLLALGDREYRNFCGFGRRLDDWLRSRGAQPLFDPVEVDNGDEQALQRWQQHVGSFVAPATNIGAAQNWRIPAYEPWRLTARTLANPNSIGQPTFHLTLEPPDTANIPPWQPGDVAEIRPHHRIERVAQFLEAAQLDGRESVYSEGRLITLTDVVARSQLPHYIPAHSPQALADALQPLAKREFSIASLAQDKRIELLVRQSRNAEGELGLASGWLTQYAWLDARIELRIRRNSSFHLPADGRPLIFICNGTGIAGIRGHIEARARAGRHRNWLIFGERNAQHDFYYRQDIERWQARGHLQRLDLAFSRDQTERIYVQNRLLAARDELGRWVEDGANLYICGNASGMAPAVDTALRDIIGNTALKRLIVEGRYRRDVY